MFLRNSERGYGLAAVGEGFLPAELVSSIRNHERLNDPQGIVFELDDDITEVEAGFFDWTPWLRELTCGKSLKKIGMTDRSLKIFRDNDVLVRGFFDTYAERFASEYGLRFIHDDFRLGGSGNYFEPSGTDLITLLLAPYKKPVIRQSNFCQGSSAGSSLGGDIDLTLEETFYQTMSAEDIAGICWGTCYDSIRKNAALAKFISKARKKGGYYLDFRKPKEAKMRRKKDKNAFKEET
ncbi:MAG: hypothetical protein J5794_00715 [Lachnospiraceae bacterium]|nr:hypothetical protein [Lachnospiraceae bacterium]